MEKNQFRLADVILSVICVVFVAEAAAPVASIGNSQYFWWIFMILAFLLPYGLIAAELGTAYAGDGGLYDWIHAAYPNGKWAARASWYYWINFPLWMASLAVMCPELITFITGRSLGTFGSLIVELLFIWIVTLIACYPVCDSIVILNVSAVIKIVLALLVGGLGVCGRPFCCKEFLDDFQPVSIKMAKEQGLSLNPAKISGSCGRLMCCLAYEQKSYEYLNSITPQVGSIVRTPDGEGTVIEVNVVAGTLKVRSNVEILAPRIYKRDECVYVRGGKRTPLPADKEDK